MFGKHRTIHKMKNGFTISLSRWYPPVLLIVIFLFGLWLRSSGATTNMSFNYERAEYFQKILATHSIFSVQGIGASEPWWVLSLPDGPPRPRPSGLSLPFYPGKLDGALLYILVKYGHFAYTDTPKAWIVIDALSIITIFWAACVFGVEAGLVASLLYSVGHWSIYFTRDMYGLVVIPFLVIFCLGSFLRLIQQQEQYWPLMVLTASILPLLHPVGYAWLVILLLACVMWHIHFPRRRIVSMLTIISSVPLVFTLYLDRDSLIHLVAAGSLTGWQSIFAVITQIPQDVYAFTNTILFGMPPIWRLWPQSVIPAIIVSIITIKMFFQRGYRGRYALVHRTNIFWWLISLALIIVILARWFYGASAEDLYNSPSFLIVCVSFYLSFAYLVGRANISSRRIYKVGVMLAVLIFVVLNTSATIHNIVKNIPGMLPLQPTKEALQAIATDAKSQHIVVCAIRNSQHISDVEYLWSLMPPGKPEAQFTATFDEKTCWNNGWYILTLKNTYATYAPPDAIIYHRESLTVYRK